MASYIDGCRRIITFLTERENYDNQKPYQRRNFGTDQVSGTKHLKRVCFIPYQQNEQAAYIESELATCKLNNATPTEEQKAGFPASMLMQRMVIVNSN